MEVMDKEKIHNLVNEIATLRNRKYQDYADLRDMYDKYISLNQLLAVTLRQYNPRVDNAFLEEHTMLRQDPVLMRTDSLGSVIDECINHNNILLEAIDMQDTRLQYLDRYRYTPVKDIDTVEVLQMCYKNVCMCLKLRDKEIIPPYECIYTDMNIDELNIADLAQLYIGVSEANERLECLLKE